MNNYLTKRKAILLGSVVALYLAIITPLLVINLQKQQELRGRAQTQIDTSLVGWWKFDEGSGSTALDSSANSSNGTLVNGPTWTTGRFGQAVNFDGVDDYVDVGDISTYDFGSNQDFTVSVWVKTLINPVSNFYPMILRKDGGSPRNGFSILANFAQYGNAWEFDFYQNGTQYALAGRSPINDGAWHNLVIQRSGSTLNTYQDGTFANTRTAISSSIASTGSLRFGNYAGYPFNGQIDDVRIYNRALSASEVSAIYNPISIPTSTPATACGNVPADIMLIIDRSGSMVGTKITEAQQAAKSFIDVIAKDSNNRIGLVSFSSTATLDSSLTNNFSSVKTKIDSLSANGNTCHECAIVKANQEIATNGRAGVKKVVVMLTDGQANYIVGGTQQVDPAIAEANALTAVTNGFTTSKTAFFTIGFGIVGQTGNQGYNGEFLQKITTLTGGKYYYPAPGELQAVYDEISLLIGKGLLGGFIFNDLNGNGAFDLNEPKLNGWQVQLTSQTATQTFTADSTGTYTITGLCDGNYQLKQILQSGWKQTLPSDPNGYSITITNGNSATDKNFGNMIAPTSTPTPIPTSTPTPLPTATPKPTNTPIPTPTPTPLARCSDAIDNDNNGFTDAQDSTCHSDGNPNNPNSYVPTKDGEHGGSTCADSRDNNNNGLIDGADPVCHTGGNPNNPWDPNLPEVNPTPTTTPNPTATPRPTSTPIPTPTRVPTLTSTPIPTNTPAPTPTSVPNATILALTIFQHGIGGSGDNTNPTGTSLSNKTPIHTTINANIEIYDVNNNLVSQASGSLIYNGGNGNYKGNISVAPNTISTGNYYLKVKTDFHLKRQSANVAITIGQTNNIPALTLVAGDTDNNNALSILDYNMLLECYSDLVAAHATCDASKKLATDFNDDGFVNQIDYNLFLREITTQPGQ